MGHNGVARVGVVDVAVVKVLMLEHEGVEIVGVDVVAGHERGGEAVAGPNASVAGSAFALAVGIGCVMEDRRGGSPDEFGAGRTGAQGGDHFGKPRGVLGFGVTPAVHAVVEVDDGEMNPGHLKVFAKLDGESRVAAADGGGEEIDVGGAGQVFGDGWIIAAGDGVADEEDVGQAGGGRFRALSPCPLDRFGDGEAGLGGDGGSGDEDGGDGEQEERKTAHRARVQDWIRIHMGQR